MNEKKNNHWNSYAQIEESRFEYGYRVQLCNFDSFTSWVKMYMRFAIDTFEKKNVDWLSMLTFLDKFQKKKLFWIKLSILIKNFMEQNVN